jgi:hypothetical protein
MNQGWLRTRPSWLANGQAEPAAAPEAPPKKDPVVVFTNLSELIIETLLKT